MYASLPISLFVALLVCLSISIRILSLSAALSVSSYVSLPIYLYPCVSLSVLSIFLPACSPDFLDSSQ